MTNRQSDKLEILARLDEVNRLKEMTDDPNLRTELEARERELRTRADNL